MKLCECGCGSPVTIAKKTQARLGHIKGNPIRFIQGHYLKKFPMVGENHPRWKGGVIISARVRILKPDHHRANDGHGYVLRYILITERALGKSLPPTAIIHHHDNNPKNDRAGNLVVCENQAYHLFLHQRTRAYNACGHPGWRKCKYCKGYDDPINLYVLPEGNSAYHKSCYNNHRKNYENKKEV